MSLIKYKWIDKHSVNFFAVQTESEPLVATLHHVKGDLYILSLPNLKSFRYRAPSWYAARGIAYNLMNLVENHGLTSGL